MLPDELLTRGQPQRLTKGLERRLNLFLIGVRQAQDVVGVSAFHVQAEGFQGIRLGLPGLTFSAG